MHNTVQNQYIKNYNTLWVCNGLTHNMEPHNHRLVMTCLGLLYWSSLFQHKTWTSLIELDNPNNTRVRTLKFPICRVTGSHSIIKGRKLCSETRDRSRSLGFIHFDVWLLMFARIDSNSECQRITTANSCLQVSNQLWKPLKTCKHVWTTDPLTLQCDALGK